MSYTKYIIVYVALLLGFIQSAMAGQKAVSDIDSQQKKTHEKLGKKRKSKKIASDRQAGEMLATTQLQDTEKKSLEILNTDLTIDWQSQGTHLLPQSNSLISIPDGYRIALDDEAKKICHHLRILSCKNIEAILVDSNFKSLIYIEYLNQKNLFTGDERILNEDIYQEDSLKAAEFFFYKTQYLYDFDDLSEKWHRDPLLNHEAKRIYWTHELTNGVDHIISASVLKIGKEGVVKITWLTDSLPYTIIENKLNKIAKSHHFKPGHVYDGDFTEISGPVSTSTTIIESLIRGIIFMLCYHFFIKPFIRKRQPRLSESQ